MNKPLKSALLSALIFPGSGHFFLKKYVRAAVLAVIAMAGLYFLMSATVEIAQTVSAKIQTGEIPLDINRIAEAVSDQRQADGEQRYNIGVFIFGACWVISIIDSYRVGLMQNKSKGV